MTPDLSTAATDKRPAINPFRANLQRIFDDHETPDTKVEAFAALAEDFQRMAEPLYFQLEVCSAVSTLRIMCEDASCDLDLKSFRALLIMLDEALRHERQTQVFASLSMAEHLDAEFSMRRAMLDETSSRATN